MAGKIDAKDLTASQRKALGIKSEKAFAKETVRQRAITLLAGLTDLTQKERDRVLLQAGKLNQV